MSFSSFSHLIIPTIVALIPSMIWIFIWNKKHPEEKKKIFLAFLAGGVSVIPILLYQKLWGATGNFIFFKIEAVGFQKNISDIWGASSQSQLLSIAQDGVLTAILGIFFVYISVGLMEEYAKFFMMKKFTRKYFRSIDDVIEFAILAALGFAFVENIFYFTTYIKMNGLQDIGFGQFVVIRVTIVTMVHVLCSGILGYYYGLAHFAHPVLQDELNAGKKLFFTKTFHKILHIRSETIFRDEKMMEGLIIAIFLHALYDFIMETNWVIGGVLPLSILLMSIYFVGGFSYLSYLIKQKEDMKVFGKLVIKEEFEKEPQA